MSISTTSNREQWACSFDGSNKAILPPNQGNISYQIVPRYATIITYLPATKTPYLRYSLWAVTYIGVSPTGEDCEERWCIMRKDDSRSEAWLSYLTPKSMPNCSMGKPIVGLSNQRKLSTGKISLVCEKILIRRDRPDYGPNQFFWNSSNC